MAAGDRPLDFILEEDGNVEVAPERFKSAQEVTETCDLMVRADRFRAPYRAQIDGLIDGNPTYTLAKLKAKGQGWRSRTNYRGAEGYIQGRQTAFYDLVTEVNPCVEVCLDFGKGVETTDWANAIAKNFHWMLMRLWRAGFNYHIPLQQLQMLKHGMGFHIWAGNEYDWIPETPITGRILFPDDAPLNIQEKLDYFMFRDFVPGFALYQKIKNEKAAAALGWNVDTTWRALAQTSKNKQTLNGRWTGEQLQREMRNGDIGTTQSRQAGLWLNSLIVKNIKTGNWDQYTVAEGITPASGKKINDPFANCLYRKRNRFKKLPLVMFNYDVGNGDIQSVRGLGARTKDFFELQNRITNAMADQVLMGSLMTATQTGNVDPDKMKLMRLGMLNIIPAGLNIVPGIQFPPLAQGPIAFTQLLDQTLQKNNESYAQDAPEPRDRETGQSYSQRVQHAGQLGKSAHSLYASNYQQMLERMLRTAVKPEAARRPSLSGEFAKMFQEKCFADGVPPEAFKRIYEVNEVVSVGAGSPAARIDAILTIMRLIYPTTTEERKINIERDLVAALNVTSSKVDRYARSHDDNQLPNSDASLAVQENNGLSEGGDALAADGQDHVAHCQQHLAKAGEITQAIYAGQMDPAQGLIVLQKFGKHIADHLKILQTNPMRKAEFDALHKEWLSLSVITDKIQQQVQANAQAAQQAAQQQPPQEKISDDLKIGMAKVASGERQGMAKVAADGRVNMANAVMNARIKAKQAQNGSAPVGAGK